MDKFIAGKTIKKMIKAGKMIKDVQILMLGIIFKEDCPDIRNTWVVDIIAVFDENGTVVDVFDPCVDVAEVKDEYQIDITADPFKAGKKYDAIKGLFSVILTVLIFWHTPAI